MKTPELQAIESVSCFYHVTCKERLPGIYKWGLDPKKAQREEPDFYEATDYRDNIPLNFCTERALPGIINMKRNYWDGKRELVVLKISGLSLTSRNAQLDRSHGLILGYLASGKDTVDDYLVALHNIGCIACFEAIPWDEITEVSEEELQNIQRKWQQ